MTASGVATATEPTKGRGRSAADSANAGPPSRAVTPPPKLRRRPVLIAAAVVAVALGGALGAWAWSSASSTQSVVAARTAIERGAVIQAGDLVGVQVGVDPALSPVPASQSSSVVGQRAATDIAAGTLVTREQFTAQVVPPAGSSIVGVGVTDALLPGEPLVPGDRVRVVATPGAQGDITDTAPVTIAATVVGVHSDEVDGVTVVSVQVPSGVAAELAARAATGNVAIVLDSRER